MFECSCVIFSKLFNLSASISSSIRTEETGLTYNFVMKINIIVYLNCLERYLAGSALLLFVNIIIIIVTIIVVVVVIC